MVVSLASQHSDYGRHARGSTLAAGATIDQRPQRCMSETTQSMGYYRGLCPEFEFLFGFTWWP
jgi:hypothetical protein